MSPMVTFEHMKIFFDAIQDMVFFMEVEGERFRYKEFNAEARKLFSYPDNAIGKFIEDVLPPEIASHLNEKYRIVARTKQPLTYEDTNLLASEKFVAETTLTPIFNADGVCTHIVAVTKNIIERKQAEQERKRMVKELADIKFALDEAAIVAITDTEGVIEYVNDMFCEISQYKREELLGQTHRIICSGYHSQEFFSQMWKTIRAGKVWKGDVKNKAKDGSYYWVKTIIVPFLDEEGRPYQYISVRTDITEQKRVEEALRQREEKYRIITENASDLIIVIDREGIIEYASPSHDRILSFPVHEQVRRSYMEIIDKEDEQAVWCLYEKIMVDKEQDCGELRYRHRNGTSIWVEAVGSPVLNEEGEVERIVIVAREATERKKYEDNLKQLAYHDALTGLPNRRRFEEQLQEVIAKAKQENKLVAVLYIDCDYFKQINDTMGHDIGDAFLQKFAQNLQACVRESDIVARIGGDEFIILLSGIDTDKDAEYIAQRIIGTLQHPWKIGNYIACTTSSIGISLYPTNGIEGEALIKKADQALYYAKEKGRNTYVFFSNNSAC